MNRTTRWYWVACAGFLVIMVAAPSSLAEGSVDAYYATEDKIEEADRELEELERKRKRLKERYEELQAEIEKWKKQETGFEQHRTTADEFEAIEEQEQKKNQQKQDELDKEEEKLHTRKEELKEQLKKDIPPPPWESHEKPKPDDFDAQRKQAYENSVWKSKFGSTQEVRDGAREMYIQQKEAIDKAEEAAKRAAKKKQAKKPQQKPVKKTPSTGTTSKTVAVSKPPPTANPSPLPTTPASKPSSGPGKENPPKIWEVGEDAPPWLFLTPEQIRVKKEGFKMSEYGFREIRTPDGRVIDVIADKDPTLEIPPVGHITVGKGDDAKTTVYKYKEKTEKQADGTEVKYSTKILEAKREFPSVNEQKIAAIRKKQDAVFKQDFVVARNAQSALANAGSDASRDAMQKRYSELVTLWEVHWIEFELQIQKLDPSYKLGPPPTGRGRKPLEEYFERQTRKRARK